MKRLCFAALLLSTALPPVGALAAENEYSIMRPDNETRLQWMKEDLSQPEAYSDSAIKLKRGSFSLLGSLPYVPAERNQGHCGNCWTWAGTGCAEIDHAMQGISDRLSVQYITSCKADQFPCCGGTLSQFANWYAGQRMFIPWSNSNAFYSDATTSCSQYASVVSCGSIATSPYYPVNSISASTISTYGMGQAAAVQNIKNALNQNKAVFFGFFLPNQTCWDDFQSFWEYGSESGAYYDFSRWSGLPWTSGGGGHAVLLVGYNDDLSPPCWIVVNSWGIANGNRPQGTFLAKMYMNYDAYVNYPDPANAMMVFQTLDVDFGAAPTPTPTPTPTPIPPPPACPIRANPDRASFSAGDDRMQIIADTEAISTACYPYVRIMTPYYGAFYLTSRNVIYRSPVAYLRHPIVINQPVSGYGLARIWWRNIKPGTYYLESGAVDAWTGAELGPVHTTAFTLN